MSLITSARCSSVTALHRGIMAVRVISVSPNENISVAITIGNLDICLNYRANAYFQSRNSVRVIFCRKLRRKAADALLNRAFGRALEQFSRFRDRNPFQK